ncbi:branched-chain amino acid ABC transporter permease [Parazoarcus communis]|uniref:Branched-chain amino acid ABC transporter permease n=1 Tax=Parazoarcus communis SWub3 = DSM 12120 TaxID=1121029 RepID=A0A323UPX5_9RHOO|nr:branched-chain amino acid ABC transporter permease [Parazoarcus communis]NMG72599.1 branched-chain amino acid ABC transporter permease [Parazoarcus communis SWub3 = DSM 12120]PZA14377.1 branched-chain amino acid ABC transporter permease [Azoarcus communis] [Parazoarcus communis SWub3 = DSM 12120]
MNLQIAMILGQDGITNGAIYALLALSILLVFTVTRVLFIPLGEFVAFGALTMAAFQAGKAPALIWLVAGFAVAVATADLLASYRNSGRLRFSSAQALRLTYPFVLGYALYQMPLADLPMSVQVLLTLAIVVPLGPQTYRLFYQPIASAPVLILLIVSIAVHVALVGLALLVFGPSGAKTAPFSEAGLALGPITLNSQTLWVIAVSIALIIVLYQFFERTIYGKALRATAINRVGAQLMGISPVFAGKASFFLATLIATLSGVLIAPITTIYYDSGFIISLKGFIGSIIGGLVSYPIAALGAVLVGLLEAFSAFWASTYKEVIVFTLIIPFLLWRSLTIRHVEEEE